MSTKRAFFLDDEISFGIYKGTEIWELINNHTKYIEKLMENDEILLSDEAYSEYQNTLKQKNDKETLKNERCVYSAMDFGEIDD